MSTTAADLPDTRAARADVLARVRTALGDDRGQVEPVPRDYRTDERLDSGERLDLLAERVADYRATVVRLSDGSDGTVAEAVAAALGDVGARRVVVPPGVSSTWLAEADVEVVVDRGDLSVDELDGVDAAVTGCAAAIAETGTLVLDGSEACGRRALTLVPDVHVCVVRGDDVVEGVPAALRRLDPLRPLTFVSGPSATSDIELDRVEGVHGPRTLFVLVVDA